MAVTAEAAKLRAQGAKLVDFGAGEPHFPTPQHIKDAAIEAIQKNFTKYTMVSGIPELRQAIVERHAQDFGSSYTPEEAIFSTGGKLAIFNAIQVLVDHGDEVIVPVPFWVSYKDIVQYAGAKCVFVEAAESDGFRTTAEAIERAITPKTKAILLNSPSNPSGAVVAAMSKLQSQSTSSTASFVQKAAIAALKGDQSCVGVMRADYLRLRDEALAGLAKIPGVTCVKPDGAFYVYPNVSHYLGKAGVPTAMEMSKRLLHEAHVVTVPGEAFGTEQHIRLSYATSHEDVAEGLERMKAWFAKL